MIWPKEIWQLVIDYMYYPPAIKAICRDLQLICSWSKKYHRFTTKVFLRFTTKYVYEGNIPTYKQVQFTYSRSKRYSRFPLIKYARIIPCAIYPTHTYRSPAINNRIINRLTRAYWARLRHF